MNHADIELKVREIISRKFSVPLDTIGAESRLIEDLHLDSFGAVELMFELEEEFNLKIADSDIERVRSVNQVVEYLEEWLLKKTPAVATSSHPVAGDSPPPAKPKAGL